MFLAQINSYAGKPIHCSNKPNFILPIERRHLGKGIDVGKYFSMRLLEK